MHDSLYQIMFYILADGFVSMAVISDVVEGEDIVVCIDLAGSASILGDFLKVIIQVSNSTKTG